MASWKGKSEYMYNGKGGMSWAVPYLAGLFALALQINTQLSQQELVEIVNKNISINQKRLKIIDPKKIIEAIEISHQG